MEKSLMFGYIVFALMIIVPIVIAFLAIKDTAKEKDESVSEWFDETFKKNGRETVVLPKLDYKAFICRKLETVQRTAKNHKFLNDLSFFVRSSSLNEVAEHAAEMLTDESTLEEESLYKHLALMGVDFIPQCFCKCDKVYILDCYLPKYHINVEVDGGYHFTKEQKEKDYERTKDIYKHYRIKTYRFTNNQIDNGSFQIKLNEILKNITV